MNNKNSQFQLIGIKSAMNNHEMKIRRNARWLLCFTDLKKFKIIFCIFWWLILSGIVKAASFDCEKAASKVEKLICSNEKLSSLDDQLNSTYKKSLENNAISDEIKQSQKKWMKARNGCSDTACVQLSYEKRLNELIESSQSKIQAQSNNDSPPPVEQPGPWVQVFPDFVSEILVREEDYKPDQPIKIDSIQIVLTSNNTKLIYGSRGEETPEQEQIAYAPYDLPTEFGDFSYILYNHYRLASYVNGKIDPQDGCIYPTANEIKFHHLRNGNYYTCGTLFNQLKPGIREKFAECAAKHKKPLHSKNGRFFISNDQLKAQCLTSIEYESRVNNRIKNEIFIEMDVTGSHAQGYASVIPYIRLDQELFHCSEYGLPVGWRDPSRRKPYLMKKQYLIKTGGFISCFDTKRILDEPREFGIYLNDGTVLLRGNLSVLRIRLSDGSNDAPTSVARGFNEGILQKLISDTQESPEDLCEFFNCPVAERAGWHPTPWKALRPSEENDRLTKELFPYVIRAVDSLLLEYFESTR